MIAVKVRITAVLTSFCAVFFAGVFAAAENVELVGQIGGACNVVEVQGNYAYIGEGANLLVVDVSNPQAPQLVGKVLLPGIIRDLAVSDAFAYAAVESYDGLQIIDLSNRTAPVLRGRYDMLVGPRGVSVSGSLAYAADANLGLLIIDVSDPDGPFLRTKFETLDTAEDVVVSGSLAYVVNPDWGLQIIDVSDPDVPVSRGSYNTPGNSYGCFVSGSLAYVLDTACDLQIVDVSNPDAPVLRGSYNNDLFWSEGVSVSGSLAYLAGSSGLQIIDVSNPDVPVEAGVYDTTYVSGVIVTGSLAYLTDPVYGLQIIDVSEPSDPAPQGSFLTSFITSSPFVSGTTAYAIDGSTLKLSTIDVTDPAAPVVRGDFDLNQAWCFSVFVSGSSVFISGMMPGLNIVDVADPDAPVLRGRCDVSGFCADVLVSGSFAYVVVNENGLCIIDVSDPDNPFLRGIYDTPDVATDVSISGSLAYVTDSSSGLQIIDVSNPDSPVLRGTYDTLGPARGVFVSGSLAYVLDEANGLQIIDVSNPGSPVLVGSCDTVYCGESVYVSGSLAYITDYFLGLQVIDVSNPSLPTLKGGCHVPNCRGVFVSGSLAYVRSEGGGLYVLRYDDPSITRTPTATSTPTVTCTPTATSTPTVTPLGHVEAPTGLIAEGGAHSIRLRWNPNTESDLAGYNVYRDTSFGGEFTTKINGALVKDTTYVDHTADPGVLYFYRVTAKSTSGFESDMSNAASASVGTVVVWMPDVRAPADATATLQINVAYATGITGYGMDIKVAYDKTLLTPVEIQKTVLTEDLIFTDNVPTADGQIEISGVSEAGATITGEGHILDVLFNVSPSAVIGATGSFVFTEVKMYDAAPNALSVDYSDTAIFTVSPYYVLGDVNGDGEIDLADFLEALRIAIGKIVPTELQIAAGDVNGDGRIDIADAILIHRMVIGLPTNPHSGGPHQSSKVLETHTMSAAHNLSIPGILVEPDASVSVPVTLDNVEGVAGLDLVVNFDPSVLLLESVVKGDLTQLFTLDYDVSAGSVHISLASAQPLSSGSGVILRLNFTVVGLPGSVTALLPAYLKLGGEFGENIAWQNTVGKTAGSLTVSTTTGISNETWLLYR